MTNRGEEIAATYGIAAVESEGCVPYVLQTYWSEFNGGARGKHALSSKQSVQLQHLIYYPLYKDSFSNQLTCLYKRVFFFSKQRCIQMFCHVPLLHIVAYIVLASVSCCVNFWRYCMIHSHCIRSFCVHQGAEIWIIWQQSERTQISSSIRVKLLHVMWLPIAHHFTHTSSFIIGR